MNEFLIKRGYSYYPERVYAPYKIKNLYEKIISDSVAVCETNGKLRLFLYEYRFEDGITTFSIGIRAQREGIWWDLNAYSMHESDFIEKIEFIENALIRMFNTI